jgi:hypothetical protein
MIGPLVGQSHRASPARPDDDPKPAVVFILLSGPVGVALFESWLLTRRPLRRRGLPRLRLRRSYAPLAGTLLFTAAALLILLDIDAWSWHHPLRQIGIAGCLAAAAACAVRFRRAASRRWPGLK